MSKYCATLYPTSFDDFVEALSEVHDWIFYIYKGHEIEIVKSAQYNGLPGYLIRRKDSSGEPIFVYKGNVNWWLAKVAMLSAFVIGKLHHKMTLIL